MCRYSLEALGDGGVCPECGIEIRLGLVESESFARSVRATRHWSLVGLISCPIIAIGLGFFHTLMEQLGSINAPSSKGMLGNAWAWVWISLLILAMPFFFIWHQNARRKIYLTALQGDGVPRVRLRAVVPAYFAFYGAFPIVILTTVAALVNLF